SLPPEVEWPCSFALHLPKSENYIGRLLSKTVKGGPATTNGEVVELIPLGTSFAIGIGCSMMPCCIGIYPGLFAYLDTARDKASRLRAGIMSAFFATGILAVVAALGLGVLLLQIGLATISNDSLFIVDLIGFPILALIGASYLLAINSLITIS